MKKKPAAHEIPEATAVPEHLKNAPNTAEATAGPAKQTAEDSAGNTAMGQNRAQDTMNELKRMEKNGRPYTLMKYKQCKSWQAKREFASKLQLDKTASWLGVEEAEYLKENKTTKESAGWCYLWGVARLNNILYNCSDPEQMKFLKSLVAGCPEKEADTEELQRQGHKMFDYSKTYEQAKETIRGKGIEIKATGKLEHEEGAENHGTLQKDA